MAALKTTADDTEAREAKRAAEAALQYFKTVFGQLHTLNLSLEEIELSPDRKYWLVTLSFDEARQKAPELPSFLRVPRQKFKVFKVERQSGRVVSMKMRNGQ